jgi:hypothetical protein
MLQGDRHNCIKILTWNHMATEKMVLDFKEPSGVV